MGGSPGPEAAGLAPSVPVSPARVPAVPLPPIPAIPLLHEAAVVLREVLARS